MKASEQQAPHPAGRPRPTRSSTSSARPSRSPRVRGRRASRHAAPSGHPHQEASTSTSGGVHGHHRSRVRLRGPAQRILDAGLAMESMCAKPATSRQMILIDDPAPQPRHGTTATCRRPSIRTPARSTEPQKEQRDMWFIIDDQMADDRRIRRRRSPPWGCGSSCASSTPKASRYRAKDPAAYPGYFDKLRSQGCQRRHEAASAQLVDSGTCGRREHDGGWRPVYAGRRLQEPRLTEEQREARRKAGSKGGRARPANQKAKQTSSDLPENSQANGEQNGSEMGSKPSSKLLRTVKQKHGINRYRYRYTFSDPSRRHREANRQRNAGRLRRHRRNLRHHRRERPQGRTRSAGPHRDDHREPGPARPTPIRRPTLPASRQRRPRATTAGPTTRHMAPRPMGDMGAGTHHTHAPAQAHLNCEHVHQLMDPHEDEYDHTRKPQEASRFQVVSRVPGMRR